MKKLLITLSALGMGLSTTPVLVSCGIPNNDKVKPPVLPEPDPDDQEKILLKLTEILESGEALKIKDYPHEVTETTVKNQLVSNYLTEFKDWTKIQSVEGSFQPIEVNETEIQSPIKAGSVTFQIVFNGITLVNPLSEDNNFDFTFLNEEYGLVDEVLKKLTNEPISALSHLKLNINNSEMSLQEIIKLLELFLPKAGLIPDQVPENFDKKDPNWVQWTETLNSLKTLFGFVGLDIDEQLEFSIPIAISDSLKADLKIKAKVADLLTAILPDLIHFRNFMLEKREIGSENFILLLIQYLFDTPRDIRNDGFLGINQKIPDNKNPGASLTFATNLEHLVHNLLEGWQNVNGQMWANETKTSPLDLEISALNNFIKIKIKYQGEGSGLIPKALGFLDLIPIENLKNFMNQFFDFNLNEPLKLVLVLPNLPIIGGGEQEIAFNDLGEMIKNSFAAFLSDIPNVNDLKLDWKEGRMKIEYLTKRGGKWQLASSLEDLLNQAIDFRIKFVENVWEVSHPHTEKIFKLADPTKNELIFELDIFSSIIC